MDKAFLLFGSIWKYCNHEIITFSDIKRNISLKKLWIQIDSHKKGLNMIPFPIFLYLLLKTVTFYFFKKVIIKKIKEI